jgi:ribosomal protein S18 acetylase RimI-like enzyme
MRIRPFEPADTVAVVRLWEEAGLTRPWNDPYRDIERKLTVQPDLFLVGELDGTVVSSAMAGYDGHRGWVYYLAVHPEHQGRGLGTAILREAEQRLTALGCPKVTMQVRPGNDAQLARAAAWGYQPDEATGLGKRLIED